MAVFLNSIFLLVLLSASVSPCEADELKPSSNQANEPEKEFVTIYTGVDRSKETFKILKELAPHMKTDGNSDKWTQIKIRVVQGDIETNLTINHDPQYYIGKSWELQKLGMHNYFSQFPENQHKKRSLRLIQRLNFAVACILEPARVEKDKRLSLILSLSKKLRAIMFVPTPGSLIDSDGRVIMRVDGYADPEARVDL